MFTPKRGKGRTFLYKCDGKQCSAGSFPPPVLGETGSLTVMVMAGNFGKGITLVSMVLAALGVR